MSTVTPQAMSAPTAAGPAHRAPGPAVVPSPASGSASAPAAPVSPAPVVQAPVSAAPVPPASPVPLGGGATVHRDPVVTLDGRVVGYVVTVTVDDPPLPADLLHRQYMALDLPNLVADRYAFVPATTQMLDGFVPVPAVPGRLVLQLPLGFEHFADAVARAAALRGLGMELALLDYRGTGEQEAVLPHVGFVVVDPSTPGLPLPALVHHVHNAGARVLAADVHAPDVEDACRAAGVDGLYGGYVRRTEPPADAPQAPSRVLRAGELQCLALLHLLTQPEVDFAEVAQVVDTDPVLTLRTLNLVNSGAFALRREVDTVHQAVVLLGVREVTVLVSTLLVDARPDAMDSLWFILARSLTCEILADDPAGYTVGMLSALAGQLGVPPEVILDKVGVSQAVRDAVAEETGPLGSVLAAVRAHERRDPGAVLAAGLLPAEVSSAYVRCVADALATARTVTRGPDF